MIGPKEQCFHCKQIVSRPLPECRTLRNQAVCTLCAAGTAKWVLDVACALLKPRRDPKTTTE